MLLAQQQLLEPAPARVIRVPVGHDSWWGVDTSVSKVAVAWIDGDLNRGVVTIPLTGTEGVPRLAYAFEEVRDAIRDEVRARGIPKPGLVLVEQPSGKFDKPQLSYMVGVVQAALYAGAVLGGAKHPVVETVTSSWWKRRACGNGAIKKTRRVEGRKTPAPVPHDEYQVLRWAWLNGYTGDSWDEADAWAMADAGRREVALTPEAS